MFTGAVNPILTRQIDVKPNAFVTRAEAVIHSRNNYKVCFPREGRTHRYASSSFMNGDFGTGWRHSRRAVLSKYYEFSVLDFLDFVIELSYDLCVSIFHNQILHEVVGVIRRQLIRESRKLYFHGVSNTALEPQNVYWTVGRYYYSCVSSPPGCGCPCR